MINWLNMAKSGLTPFVVGMLSLLVSSLPLKADFIDGHQLNTYCSSQDPADDMICIVYVTGAFDAFTTSDLISQKSNQTPPALCPPADTSPDELKQVTLDWLGRPETNLNFAATLIVLSAISDKYGCEK